jgi:hypothetical protein
VIDVQYPNIAPPPVPWLYQPLWQSQAAGGFGYQAKVYKSVLCPCGNSPGSPNNINCAACGGYGILYPEPSLETTVLIPSIDQNLELMQYGLMEQGDMVVSPMPGTLHFDDFDLVIMPFLPGVPTFSETFQRGSGDTDQSAYRMVNVEGAWTVDPVTGISTKFTPNQDFTFSGKTITWIGEQPAPGQLYSIRYGALFEWVSFNPASPRYAFGQDLGQKAVLRKRHIVLPNAPNLIEG